MTPQQIRDLAVKTSDAYSADAYTSWISVIRMLAKRGYNEREIEAIVRSKWTRWARDASSKHGLNNAKDLANYLDNPRNNCSKDQVADLIGQTFEKQDLSKAEWQDIVSIVKRETSDKIVDYENDYEKMLKYLHRFVEQNKVWIIESNVPYKKMKEKAYKNYILRLSKGPSSISNIALYPKSSKSI